MQGGMCYLEMADFLRDLSFILGDECGRGKLRNKLLAFDPPIWADPPKIGSLFKVFEFDFGVR